MNINSSLTQYLWKSWKNDENFDHPSYCLTILFSRDSFFVLHIKFSSVFEIVNKFTKIVRVFIVKYHALLKPLFRWVLESLHTHYLFWGATYAFTLINQPQMLFLIPLLIIDIVFWKQDPKPHIMKNLKVWHNFVNFEGC